MPEEEEEGMAVWGWAVGLSLVLLAYIGLQNISFWMAEGGKYPGAVSAQDKHAGWGRERLPSLMQ